MEDKSRQASLAWTIKKESFAPILISVCALGPIMGFVAKGSTLHPFEAIEAIKMIVQAKSRK
jgi:hypothetical protein